MVAPFHYLPSLAGSDKENQPLNTGRGKAESCPYTHLAIPLQLYLLQGSILERKKLKLCFPCKMAPWRRQGPIPLSYQFYRMSHCNESLQWSYTGTGISDSKTSPYGKVELNMDEANRFSRGYSKNLIFMSYTGFFF